MLVKLNMVLLMLILFGYLLPTKEIRLTIYPEIIYDYNTSTNATHSCSIPCEFVHDYADTDGLVVIMENDKEMEHYRNLAKKYKISIVYSHEGGHFYSNLKLKRLKEWFTATATMDVIRSDIPSPLLPNFLEVAKLPLPENMMPKAVFVARNCYPLNNRNEVVDIISRIIPVDCPSSCYHNTEWPECEGKPCSKVEVLKRYMFYLAFENGEDIGYVTEKIGNAYTAGVLPVYLGTSDIKYFVPEGSYIDVRDFNSPNEVGIYLAKLARNKELYEGYFDWKKKPLAPEFLERYLPIWNTNLYCRMCKFTLSRKNNLQWNRTSQSSYETTNSMKIYKSSSKKICRDSLTVGIFIVSFCVVILLLYRRKVLRKFKSSAIKTVIF